MKKEKLDYLFEQKLKTKVNASLYSNQSEFWAKAYFMIIIIKTSACIFVDRHAVHCR